MVVMDFKGIKWVGNVYQKFEAMCLEVEEIIVQDTSKYVENQVQTVGASVKKFYSDMVQDLLPESSMASVKPSSACILHEYAHICSFEKTKEMTREETSKEDSEVIHNKEKKDGYVKNFHGLDTGDNRFKASSRQYSDGVMHRRAKLGAKRISRKENLSRVVRPQIDNGVEKDSSGGSTVHLPSNKDHEPSYEPETISLDEHSSEVTRVKTTEESCNKNMCESQCVSGVLSDAALTNAVESIGGEAEIQQSCAGSSSSESNDFQAAVFPDDVASASNPGRTDELTTGSFEMSTFPEQEREILQRLSQKPLEESCILVNEDEIHFVPYKYSKRKPCKKKIRDAITSRMRSSRKQEYEWLALQWYAGDDAESNKECLKNTRPIGRREDPASTHHICESDWELL